MIQAINDHKFDFWPTTHREMVFDTFSPSHFLLLSSFYLEHLDDKQFPFPPSEVAEKTSRASTMPSRTSQKERRQHGLFERQVHAGWPSVVRCKMRVPYVSTSVGGYLLARPTAHMARHVETTLTKFA